MLNNPKIVVDATEVINMAVPKYVQEFKEFIQTVPARVQANYMIWRNVKFAMSYLDEEAIEIILKCLKEITGKASKSPRWEKCVKSTAGLDGTYFYYYEGSLSNAIGSMYVRKYFKGAAIDPNLVGDPSAIPAQPIKSSLVQYISPFSGMLASTASATEETFGTVLILTSRPFFSAPSVSA